MADTTEQLMSFWNQKCKDATKWELIDWEEIFRRRRIERIESGELRRERIFDVEEADRIARICGFDADDLICILTPVEVLRQHNRNYQPAISERGKMADYDVGFMVKGRHFPGGV